MLAEGWVAALATPFAGACGMFIWNNVWTGDAFTLNFVKNAVSSVSFLSFGLLTLGGSWLSQATPGAVRWLLTSAFIGITIGDNMWLYSLRVLGARRVILIDILKPFIASIFARLQLAEAVEPRVVLGMALTMVGVLAVSLEKNSASDQAAGQPGEDRGRGSANTEGVRAMSLELAETPLSKSTDQCTKTEATQLRLSAGAGQNTIRTEDIPVRSRRGGVSSDSLAWGYVAAAANITFDVWAASLTKQHGTLLNTFEINFIRFGSAAAVLALGVLLRGHLSTGVAAIRGVTAPPSSASFPQLLRRAWAQVLLGIMMTSIMAPALGNFALFRIDFAVYATIRCIGPIYALPLGFLIKGERVTVRALAGSLLAVLGVVPMFLGEKIVSAGM